LEAGYSVQVLQLLISGIAQGCIYGLIALGFVLIYKATETVSFAQGELMMLGAFGGLAGMTLLGFPYWLSVICAIAGMAVFGMLLERVVIRPILGQPAHRLRGARADHHDSQHRHRNPHPARTLQRPNLEAGWFGVERRANGGDCCDSGLIRSVVYSV
jgi:hypothetical protein